MRVCAVFESNIDSVWGLEDRMPARIASERSQAGGIAISSGIEGGNSASSVSLPMVAFAAGSEGR